MTEYKQIHDDFPEPEDYKYIGCGVAIFGAVVVICLVAATWLTYLFMQ